jgi:phosphorylcholine metabolism protein LicD
MSTSWVNYDTEKKYQEAVSKTSKYGPYRVKMAKIIRDFLTKNEYIWYLDTGTLLGAYRNGKMIPHDDDFDMALLADYDTLHEVYEKLKNHLFDTEYKVRLINTYCQKIEIYDPTHGSYMLDDSHDFHNVTIDLQLYVKQSDGAIKMIYHKHDLGKYVKLNYEMIGTPKEIVYEGETFMAPQDTESYLKGHYDYIGEDAKYNPETRMYEKIVEN